MRSLARLLPALLVAAALAVGGAAAPAVAAGEGDVTWGVRTAANDNGADRQNFAYRIEPGKQISDALVVSNHAATPLELDVYAADGFTTTSGQLDLVTQDTDSVAVGAWTSLQSGRVTIAPGTSVEVPFTVSVPADATPGDYAGGLLTSLPHTTQEDGISVDRRLGIRMHVRVDGELAPAIAVEKMHVDYSGTFNPFGSGSATVSYTVHNTGNVRLSAGQTVTLAGPFGWFPVDTGEVAAVPELLPGESWTVAVPVDGVVPAFWLTAKAALSPKLPTVTGSTPGVDGVAAEAGALAVPWSLVVLVLLIAAAVVAAVIVLRRRRKVAAAREDERVKKAVEEALREAEAEPVA
ncbi:WxL protein peptidoglycan domain-containing protein [Leifsonia sp. NPDC058194]|uniref:WxL protein peptidoglycan domain-containing protein n=1 Tax=Leifsonia sp. NPDC058194 TaxID=3346374 RepID=UPI0036DEB89E